MTGSSRFIKTKLQRQDNINHICLFHKYWPDDSHMAVRLIFSNADNAKKKKISLICMVGGTMRVNFHEPIGAQRAKELWGYCRSNFNVICFDPTSMVWTWGCQEYPAWTKKWLRWELLNSAMEIDGRNAIFSKLGQADAMERMEDLTRKGGKETGK